MDFKMKTCRKIAELTQVIDVLFTQNHEKDLIINELKQSFDNYQVEMEDMVKSSRNCQITMSEQDKRIIMKEISDQFVEEERKIKNYYGASVTFLQNELEKSHNNLSKLEKQFNNNNSKYEKLLFEKSTKETLLQDEIFSMKQEVNSLNEKYKMLQLNHEKLAKRLSNSETENKHKLDHLKSENSNLNSSIVSLKEERFILENKCKEMEMELGSITKQLTKQKIALQRSETASSISQKTTINVESQVNEDLRKELIRYKLELINRDDNFTKLFNGKNSRIQEPFHNKLFSQSNGKKDFKAVIGISQRQINNATVKIISAQYDKRKTLPNISKPYIS